MCRSAILIALLCFKISLVAQNGAVIHLLNGDRLTGQIISETPEFIILKTDWTPQLKLPQEQIRSVKRQMSSVVAKSASVKAESDPPAPQPVQESSPKPPPPPPPAAKPAPKVKDTAKKPKSKSKAKPKSKPSGKWAHDLRLGLDLHYSNVDRQSVHTRIRSSYTRKNWRTLFDWSYSYGKSERLVTSDKMNAQMKTDLTFDPGWYVYGLTSGGYDITRRIELRMEYGGGAGYHLLKGRKFLFEGSKLSMDLETGGEFQDKKSTRGTSTQKYFWRIGHQTVWDPTQKLRISQEIEFYPKIGELINHRYQLESNISYKLIKNLTLNFTVLVEAEPENISEFDPDDIQLRSSLGWKF